MLARISVPRGTRISGPGTDGCLLRSAKASVVMPGSESPFGYQVVAIASSETESTPLRSTPAAERLEFAAATGKAFLVEANVLESTTTADKSTAVVRRMRWGSGGVSRTTSDARSHP